MFDDLTPFYRDFGSSVTVAGVSTTGIFDISTPDSFGIVASTIPSLRVSASVAAAVGDAVTAGGSSWVVAAIHAVDPRGSEKMLVLK